MKVNNLLLVVALSSLAACGDKADEQQPKEKTTLMEKTGEMGDKLAETVKESSREAAATVSKSYDSARETVSESVEAVSEKVQSEVADTLQQGQDAVGGAVTSAAAVAVDPQQAAAGKGIYTGRCMNCHTAGLVGAPKLGDAGLWQPRIAQGMDVLYQHAINGFKGNTGYMPPKGGYKRLSEDDIKAAVAYMVSMSQ